MSLLLDSFWRAVAYCLHPRVIALSLLPLVVMVAVAMGVGYFFWDSAVNAVFMWLESSALFSAVGNWLASMGLGGLRNALAPVIVVFSATPVVVVGVLLLVAMWMMPAILRLVAARRFPGLERKRGGGFLLSLGWSLASTLLAVLAMIVSIPLWLVPPLVLILPPLIWGWLTYRVMAFDALAEHATREERREVFKRHRHWLLAIGIATGYLGAAPSVIWASGFFAVAFFFFLIPLAIWLYTLVFAFASLWFAHYCLAALHGLREEQAVAFRHEEPIA
ncbi:MAG TPA: EI24 domain-containing protein [Candidatus Paceibacterota bacterium]|nr:EI24 domain-containing protein [Candidatus Paceibacterota bacterium]